MLLDFAIALVTQAFAGRLVAISAVEVSCLLVAFLTGLTHPTASLVLGAAACKQWFVAMLLPSAMVGALVPLPDAAEQATAVLLLCLPGLTAVAVVGAAVADALDLVITSEHAAPGLAVLAW